MASASSTLLFSAAVAHDDVATPPPLSQHDEHALPQRADRAGARAKLTILRSSSQEQQRSHAVHLLAAECVDQCHAAYNIAKYFRRDALREGVVLAGMHLAVAAAMAFSGVWWSLVVHVMLLASDVVLLAGLLFRWQWTPPTGSMAMLLHMAFSVWELLYWRWMIRGHALGTILLAVVMCLVALQFRNFANLVNALLLHAEVCTTIGAISESANNDPAFRQHATDAGQMLASSSTSADAITKSE
jgi:hypothetical protein